MMSRTTRQFRELLATLPAQVRRQARNAYELFRQNPFHPSLRFKQVHADPLIYSARGYRLSRRGRPRREHCRLVLDRFARGLR